MDDKQEQSGTPAHTTQSTTPAPSPSPVASSAQQPHAQRPAASSPSSAHSGGRPVFKASMPWTLAQAVELQRAVQALGLQEGEVPEWKAVGKLLHPPREARSCWIKYGNIVRNNGGQGAAGETKASGAGRFGGGRGSAGGHDEDEDDGQLEDDDSESDEVPRARRRRRRPSSSSRPAEPKKRKSTPLPTPWTSSLDSELLGLHGLWVGQHERIGSALIPRRTGDEVRKRLAELLQPSDSGSAQPVRAKQAAQVDVEQLSQSLVKQFGDRHVKKTVFSLQVVDAVDPSMRWGSFLIPAQPSTPPQPFVPSSPSTSSAMHVAPNSGGLPASPKQGVGYFWRPEEEALIRSLMQKAERERKKLSYAQVARTLEATYSMRAHGLAPRAVRAVQWRVGILRGQYHKNGKKMGKSDAKGEDEEGDEGSEDAEEAMSEAQDNGFGYVEAWRSPGKRRHSSSYPSYAESGSDDVYYSPPPKIPRPSTSIKSRASHDSDSDDEATSDEEWRNEPTYARTVGVFWVRSDQSKLLQLAEEMADELQVDTLPIVAWAKIGASLRIKRSADACRKMWRKLEQEHAEGKGYFAPSGQKAGEGGTKLRGEGDHCRGPPEQRPSPVLAPRPVVQRHSPKLAPALSRTTESNSNHVAAARRPTTEECVHVHDEPFSPADDAEMLRLHALWPLGQFKKIARGLKPPRHKAEVKERLQWLLDQSRVEPKMEEESMHEIDLPPPFDTKSFALARGRPEASAEPKMADSDRVPRSTTPSCSPPRPARSQSASLPPPVYLGPRHSSSVPSNAFTPSSTAFSPEAPPLEQTAAPAPPSGDYCACPHPQLLPIPHSPTPPPPAIVSDNTNYCACEHPQLEVEESNTPASAPTSPPSPPAVADPAPVVEPKKLTRSEEALRKLQEMAASILKG